MDQFHIALAQLEPKLFEKEHNLGKAEQAIRMAADQGASAILFPELFLTGYSLGERAIEMAHSHQIPILLRFAESSLDGLGVLLAE